MTSTSATSAGWHQDLGRGAAGTALARIAAARLTRLPPGGTASWVRAMTAGPVTANASAGLFYGAPAVAFVLQTGAHPAYAAMLDALDEHVNDLTALKLAAAYERIARAELARPGEYDLISGLTGLGVYHLLRHGPAGSGMCYGTPGQARAQQLAGLALGDQERMRTAERALVGCVLDRQVTGLLTDASLCHGWAGLVQALWRAVGDALDPRKLGAALREARRGMEDHLTRTGPPASSGLLEGTSGIQLAQNDLPRAGGEPPAWDACLLLTL